MLFKYNTTATVRDILLTLSLFFIHSKNIIIYIHDKNRNVILQTYSRFNEIVLFLCNQKTPWRLQKRNQSSRFVILRTVLHGTSLTTSQTSSSSSCEYTAFFTALSSQTHCQRRECQTCFQRIRSPIHTFYNRNTTRILRAPLDKLIEPSVQKRGLRSALSVFAFLPE